MADVLLREYVQELRAHVHAGRLSDAFALGQHILRYYPKHIETYGILAQASLEADDLAGATDLFRRVLSADPENVLALAGMALLNETQSRNDEALWYLERAYEIQPTNDELRRELVRLRELYYGTTNERLELTPGALARIYARQGQYAAAVNEFRRLLRHENQRYDARVALAEILYRAGRVDEAAQLAQNIMRDAPYSLKPNLILGALWSDNAVPEGQEYLARAQALDPEYRVGRDLIGARFANMPAPRLPVIQEEDSAARAMEYGEPAAPTFEPTAETFESATEPIVVPEDIEERLRATELAEQQAQQERELSLAAAAAAVGGLAAAAIVEPSSQETAAPATTETLTETPDTTLAEIAAAEQQHAATPTPTPVETVPPPTPRARSKTDSIPTDAIAIAAAALATSIAVDKLKQPAPARRTHPALPKVRPVISGASEKLPAWLRLSATPAQASVSFDAPARTEAERIEPIVTPETPDTRPDWLVAAQTPTPDALPAAQDSELPDWLVTAAVIRPPQESVTTPAASDMTPAAESITPIAPELPEWLREPGPTQTAAPIGETPSPIGDIQAPSWLDASRDSESIAPPEIVAPASEASAPQDAIVETEPTIAQPPQAELPVWLTEKEIPAPEPAAVSIATSAPVESTSAALPDKPLDARTLIESARAKRDGGDLKGALDSYERAMHRRPNYLDEIIGDLQTLVQQPDTPGTAHRLLGEAYAMAGRYKESLEQYRLAMRK